MKKSIFTLSVLLFIISSYVLANNNALRFKISGNGYTDETIVRLLSTATEGFDGNYDAWKLFTLNPSAPSIYSQITVGQELSINALPEYVQDKSVTIFTRIPTTGNYTLTIEEVFEMTSVYKISLTDLATGNHYYITSDTTINLSLTAQQDVPTFTFNISTPIIVDANSENCYGSNDGSLIVKNMGNNDWTCQVIDDLGNIVYNNDATTDSIVIDSLPPSNYTITVSSKGIIDNEIVTISSGLSVIANFEMDADTVYLDEGGTLTLANNSINATNYLWDFGDGNNSTNASPSHTFNSIGLYTITLYASLNTCTDNTSKSVEVLPSQNLSTSINESNKNAFFVQTLGNGAYQINFKNNDIRRIDIYSLSGKMLITHQFTESTYHLSLSNYPQGIYILNVMDDYEVTSVKLFR